eukprot:1194648-Prorocentrum_minimum.AAC.4
MSANCWCFSVNTREVNQPPQTLTLRAAHDQSSVRPARAIRARARSSTAAGTPSAAAAWNTPLLTLTSAPSCGQACVTGGGSIVGTPSVAAAWDIVPPLDAITIAPSGGGSIAGTPSVAAAWNPSLLDAITIARSGGGGSIGAGGVWARLRRVRPVASDGMMRDELRRTRGELVPLAPAESSQRHPQVSLGFEESGRIGKGTTHERIPSAFP